MSNPTEEQLHTLRHMLGINTPEKRVPEPYRNYAAVVPGDPEFIGLERLGLVECYIRAAVPTRYDLYRCTDAGRTAAMRSFRTIRSGRSQRRYLKYLSIQDCFPGLTFKEFLTDPFFAQSRREA